MNPAEKATNLIGEQEEITATIIQNIIQEAHEPLYKAMRELVGFNEMYFIDSVGAVVTIDIKEGMIEKILEALAAVKEEMPGHE